MGFTANGVATPFKKSNNKQFKRSPNSRIVVIDAYDLPKQQITCHTLDNQKMLVSIQQSAITRCGAGNNQAKWEGHLIDKRMQSVLPVGTRVVIEKAERLAVVDGVWIMESTRIINLTDQSPEKAFEAVFSITADQENKVFTVQHWNEQAINIEDKAAVKALADLLEEEYKVFTSGTMIPLHGFQFRVLDNVEMVVDISPRFDWIPSIKNENGEVVVDGTPIHAAKFEELINGYTAYANERYPKHDIEIMIYKNYRHGPQSRYAPIPMHQAAPLRQLVSASTRLAIGDTDVIQGGNIAVKGVIQLTADEVDMKTRSFVNRNIVARLFPDGPIGHVCRWVKTSLGHKIEVHEELKIIKTVNA